MFALIVRFQVHPDHLHDFDDLVAGTLAGIREREPGTQIYISHARQDHPQERVFYECYADRAAFDAHENAAHTRHFLTERTKFLTADPEVWWLNLLDAKTTGDCTTSGTSLSQAAGDSEETNLLNVVGDRGLQP